MESTCCQCLPASTAHGSAGQDEEHSGHYSAVSVKKVRCLPYFQAAFCGFNFKG